MLIFALVLVLLLLIAVCLYLFLQEYLVFTSEGFRFNFGSPAASEPPAAPEPSDPLPIIELDPNIVGTSPDESDEPGGSPSSPSAVFTAAVTADFSRLLEDGYVQSVIDDCLARKLNTVRLIVKGEDGVLHIPCASKYAQGAVSESAALYQNELLKFKEEGLRLLASISVLKDNIAPRAFRESAVSTANRVIWLDYNRITWFDPYQPAAKEYLLEIMDACANLGFDEILLENIAFVAAGKTELIEYSSDLSRFVAIEAIAKAAREKADELGVTLSLKLESGELSIDDSAGQDAVALSKSLDKLYLPASLKSDGHQTLMTELNASGNLLCRICLFCPDDPVFSITNYLEMDIVLY